MPHTASKSGVPQPSRRDDNRKYKTRFGGEYRWRPYAPRVSPGTFSFQGPSLKSIQMKTLLPECRDGLAALLRQAVETVLDARLRLDCPENWPSKQVPRRIGDVARMVQSQCDCDHENAEYLAGEIWNLTSQVGDFPRISSLVVDLGSVRAKASRLHVRVGRPCSGGRIFLLGSSPEIQEFLLVLADPHAIDLALEIAKHYPEEILASLLK